MASRMAPQVYSPGDCNLCYLQKAGDSGSLSANCWFHHFSHNQESWNNFVLEYSTVAVFHDQTAAAPVSFKAICCLLDLLQQKWHLECCFSPTWLCIQGFWKCIERWNLNCIEHASYKGFWETKVLSILASAVRKTNKEMGAEVKRASRCIYHRSSCVFPRDCKKIIWNLEFDWLNEGNGCQKQTSYVAFRFPCRFLK